MHVNKTNKLLKDLYQNQKLPAFNVNLKGRTHQRPLTELQAVSRVDRVAKRRCDSRTVSSWRPKKEVCLRFRADCCREQDLSFLFGLYK